MIILSCYLCIVYVYSWEYVQAKLAKSFIFPESMPMQQIVSENCLDKFNNKCVAVSSREDIKCNVSI